MPGRRRALTAAAAVALVLACTGCGTLLGIGVGTSLDRRNMESRVPPAQIGGLAAGDHVMLVLRDGARLRGDVAGFERAGDSLVAIRVRPHADPPSSITAVRDSAALATRTVPVTAIRSLVRRDPGFGNWWVFAVIGAGFDLWVINALSHMD
jgi:hypothetical protein